MRIYLLIIIAAVGLGVGSCAKKPAVAPPAPAVTVARVIERTVRDWDEFTGKFQAVDTVEIRPRVSGYIDRIEFQEGKYVKAGEVLVRIDPRPYRAELDRARAELARAKSANDLAEIEFQRVQKLKETGAVSREELDERQSALLQAGANIAAANAAVEVAALNLSFTNVTTSVAGRVSRAEVTRGNLVTGGQTGGTLLTTVVSLDPIYVYFEGDENAYLRYNEMARSGERKSSRDARNPVQVGLANEEGWPHTGYVDFVDNQLNTRTGTLRARAVLDNKEGIFTPGMFARVRLLGSGDYRATLIEDRAVGTDQGTNFVLVVTPTSEVEYRKVTLGRLIDGLRVVRTGLTTADTIVVSGQQRIRPGIHVSPKLVEMAAEGGGGTATTPKGGAVNASMPPKPAGASGPRPSSPGTP